jgi:hypothetical protein
MRDCLPGYLLPRLVREVAGAAAKTPVLDSGNLPSAPPAREFAFAHD